jgi:hypothetical protein
VGAGKSIQNQEGTEGCLTKPDGKARSAVSGLGLGHTGPLSQARRPAKEEIVR